MRALMLPADPMDQVTFVWDYVQLGFQEVGFTIYNRPDLLKASKCLSCGDDGFCDELVRLIGHSVIELGEDCTYRLKLVFDNEAVLGVPRAGSGVRGPEAYVFTGSDQIIVEQND